jgi:glutathione S-transferase
MKLYYLTSACSLASNIALREAGLKFELVKVDRHTKKAADGLDFNEVNPKGYVPALTLDNGEVLTENVTVLQYIAERNPAAKLAPPAGTMERYRLMEWLSFINSEVHKGEPACQPRHRQVATAEALRRARGCAAARPRGAQVRGTEEITRPTFASRAAGGCRPFAVTIGSVQALHVRGRNGYQTQQAAEARD